jgi:uncharacterized protein YdeI (YjbR/CyaY-like superfamily)
MDVVFFRSRAEFRQWLGEHHDRAKELWIGFYKKSAGKAGIGYAEAVDEALCFGWIDGVRKRIDGVSYANRFSPRRPGSIWSEINIKRAGELSRLGLMQPSGLEAFEKRDPEKSKQYSYEERSRPLDAAYEERFRANEKAWEFFRVQPPSYRKAATWWVMSAKREETRLKRLATLIDDSENGRRLGSLARAGSRTEQT